jgi:hypothetical protein
MNEESHLEPVAKSEIVRVFVVITLATLVGHLIPLARFLFFDPHHGARGSNPPLRLHPVRSGCLLRADARGLVVAKRHQAGGHRL